MNTVHHFTLYLPSQGLYGEIPVTFVLTKGQVEDYAAYMGVGSPEWVGRNGDKLQEELARGLFHTVLPKDAKYRR